MTSLKFRICLQKFPDIAKRRKGLKRRTCFVQNPDIAFTLLDACPTACTPRGQFPFALRGPHSPQNLGPSVVDFLSHSAAPVNIFPFPSGVPWAIVLWFLGLQGEFLVPSRVHEFPFQCLVGQTTLHSGRNLQQAIQNTVTTPNSPKLNPW